MMTEKEKLDALQAIVGSGAKIGQLFMDNHGEVTYNDYGQNGEAVGKDDRQINLELMGRAIKAVQDRFWGNSSYAVIFCAVRDLYDHADNFTLFEDEVSVLQQELGLEYPCPPNTIASTFYNNSYLKLEVGKWKANNVKQRSILLVEAFKNAVEDLLAKEKF